MYSGCKNIRPLSLCSMFLFCCFIFLMKMKTLHHGGNGSRLGKSLLSPLSWWMLLPLTHTTLDVVSIRSLCQFINWHSLKPHSGPFSDVCLPGSCFPLPSALISFYLWQGGLPCPSQSSCLARGRSHHRLEMWTFQFLGPIGWRYPLLGMGGSRGQHGPRAWGPEVAPEALDKTTVFSFLPGSRLT